LENLGKYYFWFIYQVILISLFIFCK